MVEKHIYSGWLRMGIFAFIVLSFGLIAIVLGPLLNQAAMSQSNVDVPSTHALSRDNAVAGPAAANSQPAQAAIIQQPDDQLPLVLLHAVPEAGSQWLGTEVRFVFNQDLDEAAAESLQVTPELGGEATVDGAELIFVPVQSPSQGVRYRFQFNARMQAASGATLADPVSVEFTASSPPRVTATQPTDGSQEVEVESQMLIIFNRPIVPLLSIDDQESLPSPLTIEPELAGSGQWINTSVYAYQPDLEMAGATEYTVSVASVSAADGSGTSDAMQFRFTTAAPIVVGAQPTGPLVRPDRAISVEFSQPMDQETTESAFSVVPVSPEAAPASPIAGTITWDNAFKTLYFTPTLSSTQDTDITEYPLKFGQRYQIRVDETARSASRQGQLRKPFESTFTVVPLPAIVRTSPAANASRVAPDFSVYVKFNTYVSRTLLLDGVTVTPVLSTTQVYSYYAEYSNELQLSWFKEPNTTYTVTIAASVADEYSNALGEDYSFQFTTGDYSPFVRLESDRFTHFGAYTTTYISALYRNIDDLVVDLYRLPESEFLRLTGSNQWSVWNEYQVPEPATNLVWSRSYATTSEKNVAVRQPVSLTSAAGSPLPPGIYLVEIRRPSSIDQESFVDAAQAVVLLSNNNVVLKKGRRDDSIVWLTDLVTGQPVSDQPVRFYADGDFVGESRTDASGRASVQLSLQAENRWVPVVAIVGQPGEANYAAVSTDWSQGVAAWDFEVMGGWLTVEDITGYYYTDRPIYRPGQTVYWKGIIRAYVDGEFVVPPRDLPITVSVRDPRGDVVTEEQLVPNAQGIVSGEFQLAEVAITGFYYLESRINVGDDRFEYAGTSIQVAAYRKPEFAIETTTSHESYIQGETIEVTVDAGYFSGGPLPNAPVTWRVIADPYFFNWEDSPRDRYFSFAPYDPDQGVYQPYATSNLGLIREGSGTASRDGTFTLELPADIGEARQSQLWHIDVTVQSSTNQFVSDRISVPIHRAEYYVGINPAANVSYVGDDVVVDLVTVTPQGESYGGAELDVIIYEFHWSNVYERTADGSYWWNSSVQRTPVFTTTTTTNRSGIGDIEWQPQAGGQYQVVATGIDDRGRESTSTAFVWISTHDQSQYISWPRENNDRIALVNDKQLYVPGDTAQILVPSPFTGPVHALVTVERAGVIESHIMVLESNSEVIELPITSRHIPNIYVSVVLVKGIDETNPIPAMRVGYTHLIVDAAEKELALTVESSALEVAPSSTVTYTMTIVDNEGDVVPNADVSVALVDKALLSLAEGDTRSMMDVFYYQRTLEVTTGILLVINRDRSSQQLSEGAKGGGGGGDGGALLVREDFPDIAFWRASFVSDDDGKISFNVRLPDNLTTWTLVAKAVTTDTRVGDAQHEVVATKDLQIRPLLPRFLTAGDRAQIGAAIVNASAHSLEEGRLTIHVDGGSISGNKTLQLDALESGSQIVHTWNVEVDQDTAQLTVTMQAMASSSSGPDELDDAVRLQIPVVRYESPETVKSAGTVDEQTVTEVIYLPDAATDNGQLLVTVEPGLAAGLIDGLTYLREYTYACTEQTVSRFLPNLFTVRAMRALNLENDKLENALSYHLGIGVQRLVNLQNQDGGWGYWPGERSSVFISAYALWGLSNARMMEYPVPDHTFQDAIGYLERNYQAPANVLSDWELNELAFVHYVLAQINEGDPGRASTLYEQRERLSHYGRAFLAMALNNMNDSETEDSRVQTLMDDLFGAANISASGISWQEDTIDYRTLNTNTRTTSIVLAAFMQIEPDQPLLSQVVRWLMETRRAGRWNTTQETAWAIIGLTDYLAYSGELQAQYEWEANLNQEQIGGGLVQSVAQIDKVVLQRDIAQLLYDQANILQISRDSTRGQLYYTADLQYYLDATAISARERGIYIDRRFRLPDGSSNNSASVGDIISVTATIVAPSDLYQVLVEVPIPAGTEPIDPNLDISPPDQFNPEFVDVAESDSDPYRWRSWQPTYIDMRDDKLALFVTYLPAGTYEYTFNVRATVAGEYRVLPAYAEQMYFNEVWGRSAGSLFNIMN